MRRIVLVATVLVGSLAFAGGGHGGFHGGGGFRGGGGGFRGGWGGGGNFHPARAPSYRSSYGASYGWRAPIVVAPPRVYVAPRAYSYPSYRSGYGTTYVQPQVVLATPDMNLLPAGAVMQLINGLTYATLNGAWFFWDGARAAWVVVASP